MLLGDGQMSDYKGAALMIDALPRAKVLLGDRGYDADWFRAALADRKIAACIPSAGWRDCHPVHTAALTMLRLTGCRYSEIIGLTWGEVKGQRLKLADSKTGARTFWLGKEARAILDGLSRGKAGELVFARADSGRIDLRHFWRSVRLAAGLGTMRLHDLRHSFASRAAAMSETLPMIGKLPGHSSLQSTARYAHLDNADVVIDAQRIEESIDRMLPITKTNR